MNIFALDHSPRVAAEYHVDKHVVKMILESCQLLCTAHRFLDGIPMKVFYGAGKSKVLYTHPTKEDLLYKITHINHPSAIWCRSSYLRYLWLANLTKALCDEYTYRYGNVHKCERDGLVDWLYNNVPKNINMDMTFDLPTPAMPDECKVPGDIVQSYRNYYLMHKSRMFNWKRREVPDWIQLEEFKNANV